MNNLEEDIGHTIRLVVLNLFDVIIIYSSELRIHRSVQHSKTYNFHL